MKPSGNVVMDRPDKTQQLTAMINSTSAITMVSLHIQSTLNNTVILFFIHLINLSNSEVL